MDLLPRRNEVVIPLEKFTEYALNPEKDPNKAAAFRLALGYILSNAEKLIENIHKNLDNFECTKKGDSGHGMRYEVLMTLTGENGKTANVLTAWIDDNKNGEMRLINAYVDKKKGHKHDKRV